jgi:hypothetical protein
MTRAPFDPRQKFEVSVEGDRMSVRIDGELVVDGGLLLEASDELVALTACSVCEIWECNLVESSAVRVRRIGAYVLWLAPWDECWVFDAEQYAMALGGSVAALPLLTAKDPPDLEVPTVLARPGGGTFCPAHEAQRDPTSPFAELLAWPSRGELEAVLPPDEAEAVECIEPLSGPPIWVGPTRPDGHMAAFFPGLVRVPVWVTGPAVERALASLEAALA